ncbi:hypothetical protein [Rosenbergiella epipactidis]|uniref:hypothetical protein n=1 Tax=Rosenbergiella epipactidis TaxID=1544694 RepID=UPI001F4E9BDA|nr:hypothetical protein [Rosenbergiella epipactidis]
MTDENTTLPPDNSDELSPNEGLAKKNRQLLDENKKTRTRADELQSKLSAAEAELTEIKLTKPVNNLLSQALTLPTSAARLLVSNYADFRLEEDGSIGIYGKDGHRATEEVRDGDKTVTVPVSMTHESFGKWISDASGGALDTVIYSWSKAHGGGTTSSNGRVGPLTPSAKETQKHANKLGLA